MDCDGIAAGTLRGDLVVPDGPVLELGAVEILYGLIVDDINGLLGRQRPCADYKADGKKYYLFHG